VEDGEAYNPDDALTGAEFVEALVRLAATRYSDGESRRRAPSLAARVRRLIESHVVRGMHAADPVAFRLVLAAQPTAAAVASCRPLLRRVFRGYLLLQAWAAASARSPRAGAGGRQLAVPSEGLLVGTWLRLLGDAGLAPTPTKQRTSTAQLLTRARGRRSPTPASPGPERAQGSASGPAASKSAAAAGSGALAAAAAGLGYVKAFRMGLRRLKPSTARQVFSDAQATHIGSAAGHDRPVMDGTEEVGEDEPDEAGDDTGTEDAGAPSGSGGGGPGLSIVVNAGRAADGFDAGEGARQEDDAVMIEPEFLEALCACAVHVVPDPLLGTAARVLVLLRVLGCSPAMGHADAALGV